MTGLHRSKLGSSAIWQAAIHLKRTEDYVRPARAMPDENRVRQFSQEKGLELDTRHSSKYPTGCGGSCLLI
jgi:hypothetical protein